MTAPAGSLTGDPLTDALVPLVLQLARAVGGRDHDAIAAVREAAEDVLLVHDRPAGEAGWAMAVVAAAMVPDRAPASVLLAWLHEPPAETPLPAAAPPQSPRPAAGATSR